MNVDQAMLMLRRDTTFTNFKHELPSWLCDGQGAKDFMTTTSMNDATEPTGNWNKKSRADI